MSWTLFVVIAALLNSLVPYLLLRRRRDGGARVTPEAEREPPGAPLDGHRGAALG